MPSFHEMICMLNLAHRLSPTTRETDVCDTFVALADATLNGGVIFGDDFKQVLWQCYGEDIVQMHKTVHAQQQQRYGEKESDDELLL